MMELTILGCHSATPRENKHTTSQLLEVHGKLFLIDCGEGTQMQLRKAKVKFARIQHIFISHLHGDHFYGLVGLISTFRLLGRNTPLHIYGPEGIKEIITLQLKLANSWTDYPLYFHELSSSKSEVLYQDETVSVITLPLDHRVYTNGFLFSTKAIKRKINREAIKDLALSPFHFNQLQQGLSITLADGSSVKNRDLTLDPDPPKKYAYCSDTAYYEDLVPLIKGVDLLYHEATFLDELKERARQTMHSTAKEAATIAKKARVGKLIIGHYSQRYYDLDPLLNEAQEIFPETFLAIEGKIFDVIVDLSIIIFAS